MKRVKSKMMRVGGIVLTIAMMISMCGMPAVTAKAEETVGASCNHVCDENCGGMQAVSGSAVTACTHVHDETCGYAEEPEATIIARGECGAEGSSVQWTLDDSGTFTVSGTGAMADYTSNTLPWEEKCSSITSLIVEDGVTAIGQSAFSGCTGLTDIKIPDSVTTIGDDAFFNTGLTSIVIPDSVTSLGKGAFGYCSGLTDITISHGMTTIDKAFNGCTGLTSVTIPDSVTTIDDAFSGCTGLTSVTIPDSVTIIDYAFTGCTGLTSVKISDRVTSINGTFSRCTSLKSIEIPGSVTTIGTGAFDRCTGLKSITIPHSVTSIESSAFYGCTGLTSITIPDSVTTIGTGAFDRCTGLKSITIPHSVTSIESSAFEGCTGLTSITIPDSVTTIDDYVFYGCTGLKSITIPHSVTSIEPSAFTGCTNLTTVTTSCTPQFNYMFDYNVTVIAEHSYTYTDRGDGTHSFTCSVCGSIDTEDHDFSYDVNNNVITASCNKCETTGTATITAENVTYTGSAYANASVSYSDNWQGNRDLTIVYKQGETILDAAPVNAGDYTAYIEYKGAGVSVYFTIAKADSAITAAPTAIADLVYDGTAQNLINAGTATGGKMQYSLDGTNYSPTIPTGTDAKTYIVWYKVVGDENYIDTAPASIEVTIAPKSVTVTADDKSKTYGEPEPEFTYTATGLVGSDTLTGTLSRETGDNAGTYAITQGTLNNPNYDIAFVEGTFTINKATPVSLETPTATAITYGDTLSSSVLSDSSWAWLDGTIVPDRFTDCIAYIEVDDINYDYTGINGYDSANHRVVRDIVVTINKATLTITAKSYAIKVGATLPTYEYTVTGLVGDDTLPVDVTISCSATDNNAVGAYPITVSYEVSDSTLASCYEINYVDGTLTIAEKDTQEITADDMILTYGEIGNIGATTNGDGAITYATTSDVISVAEDGMITALKAGTATVTICAAETADYAETAKTISVTVNKAESAPNLPSATMDVSCDTKTVGAVTLPTGWAWEAADVTKPLTTGESVTAIALYKGADAGNYENETVEVVITRSACSHSGDTELKNASAATCTVDGYTGDTYCKDCGERISVGQSISAPGHDYKSEVTTEATTTSEGVRTYTCENCGDSYTESIPKLPAPTSTPTVVPTPTAAPTPTMVPTATPSPSPVPTATPSPAPTATPSPTPTQVPSVITIVDDESGFPVEVQLTDTEVILSDVAIPVLNQVIDGDAKSNDTISIELSTLENEIDRVTMHFTVIEWITDTLSNPDNGTDQFAIVMQDGATLAFDAEAFSQIAEQAAGQDVSFKIEQAEAGDLSKQQQDAVDGRPAYDLSTFSEEGVISNLGGTVTVTVSYELQAGEKAEGIQVYYVDGNGNKEACETHYDSEKQAVSWTTTHFSVYLIAYEEPATEAEKPAYVSYTVQKGDTLRAIANQFGCTVADILAANRELIKDADLILIDWKLNIPQETEADENDKPDVILPEEKKTTVYVVKKGDTLWMISQQYGCTVKDIMELNREQIKDADMIYIGWELTVPQK